MLVAALGTGRHMPAKRLSPAGLDGRHDLELVQADMPGIGPPPRGTMGPEDVRNLQLMPTARQSIAPQSMRGGHLVRVIPVRVSASGPAPASAARRD